MIKSIEFCIFGRNDNYTSDFLYRIETCINYFIDSVQKSSLKNKVFLSVLDWGSKSKIVNSINLNYNHEKVVKFYYISGTQIKNLGYSNKSIPASLPWNILIRRSSNDYIFGMGADTLLNEFTLTNLYNLLNSDITKSFNIENSLLLIERKQLPWRFLINNPSIKDINQYIRKCAYSFKSDGWFAPIGGGLGAIGLSKHQWNRVKGLDERFKNWGGNDFQLMLDTSNSNDWIELSSFGISSFHLEHCPEDTNSPRSKMVRKAQQQGLDMDPFYLEERRTRAYGAPNLKLAKICFKQKSFKKNNPSSVNYYNEPFVKILYTKKRFIDKKRRFKEKLSISKISKDQNIFLELIFKYSKFFKYNNILCSDKCNYLNFLIAACFNPTSSIYNLTKKNFGKGNSLLNLFFILRDTASFQGYFRNITKDNSLISKKLLADMDLFIIESNISKSNFFEILKHRKSESIIICSKSLIKDERPTNYVEIIEEKENYLVCR